MVTEQILREALQINDKPEFPKEIEMDQTREILDKMGYEGVFPPTLIILLPLYWRYLAHVFMSCISGQKSGADEISLVNTGVIEALASGVDFNYSNFILKEIIGNIEGKERDKFLMYPRFFQIIFNFMHQEIERRGETLELKSIGPSAFGLLKQNMTRKFTFKGLYPLVKFGNFAEVGDESESDDLSSPTETENVVISASEHEHEEDRAPLSQSWQRNMTN